MIASNLRHLDVVSVSEEEWESQFSEASSPSISNVSLPKSNGIVFARLQNYTL
jgi:hypothetical protein